MGETEDTTDDAGDLQRQLLPRRQLINATEDQAVQTAGQLQRLQRTGIMGIQPPVMHVVDQFFDIERIALRPRCHPFDQRRRRCTAALRKELSQLGADRQLRFGGTQFGKANLSEVRELLDTRRLGLGHFRGTIGQQDEHRQVGDFPGNPFQQLIGDGVNPMQILQHQQQAPAICASLVRRCLQTINQQRLQGRFAMLRLQGPGEFVVGDINAQHRMQEWHGVCTVGRQSLRSRLPGCEFGGEMAHRHPPRTARETPAPKPDRRC